MEDKTEVTYKYQLDAEVCTQYLWVVGFPDECELIADGTITGADGMTLACQEVKAPWCWVTCKVARDGTRPVIQSQRTCPTRENYTYTVLESKRSSGDSVYTDAGIRGCGMSRHNIITHGSFIIFFPR